MRPEIELLLAIRCISSINPTYETLMIEQLHNQLQASKIIIVKLYVHESKSSWPTPRHGEEKNSFLACTDALRS